MPDTPHVRVVLPLSDMLKPSRQLSYEHVVPYVPLHKPPVTPLARVTGVQVMAGPE